MQITVRETVHGPILSDVVDQRGPGRRTAPVEGKAHGGRYAVSLAWTALHPGRDGRRDLRARHGPELRRSSGRRPRDFAVPAQNLVYADIDGHIGYQAPGRIPIRPPRPAPRPATGPRRAGSPGTTGRATSRSTQMPHDVRPAGGVHRHGQPGRERRAPTPFLTSDWDYGFRSQRIRDLLEATAPRSRPTRMSQIQMRHPQRVRPDPGAGPAAGSGPTTSPRTPRGCCATGTSPSRPASPTAAAAAYYNAVWRKLLELTFHDELPGDIRPTAAAGGWR